MTFKVSGRAPGTFAISGQAWCRARQSATFTSPTAGAASTLEDQRSCPPTTSPLDARDRLDCHFRPTASARAGRRPPPPEDRWGPRR